MSKRLNPKKSRKESNMRAKHFLLIPCISIIILLMLGFADLKYVWADYPESPITIINPFPPGGLTDVVARTFSEQLEKYFKKPVVVTHKVGGGITVGGYAVASSKPDGYTLGCFPIMASMPEVYSYFIKAPYTSEDLIPICHVAIPMTTFSVRGDSPINSFSELIEYLRKNPGTTWAAFSKSSAGYIIMRQIEKRENLKITPVLLEGDAKIIPALLGGHITVGTPGYTPIKQLVEAKKIKLLAIHTTPTVKRRVEFLPDIPLISEFGYKMVPTFIGIFAPKGTPVSVVLKLSRASEEICKSPSFSARLKEVGLLPHFEDHETFRKSFEGQKKEISEIFKEIGLTAESR